MRSGAKEVYVKSRAEAEELYRGVYLEEGYANTTGRDAVDANGLFDKANYYHWDDVFDENGILLRHSPDNPHGKIKHLQIHDKLQQVIYIFFE